jgi:hypothetical protein
MAGRREAPIDPCAPYANFAYGLRALRAYCGKTYKQMGAEVNYGVSALCAAANGRKLPSRQVTLAYVRACGGSANDQIEWKRRWEFEARTHRRQR